MLASTLSATDRRMPISARVEAREARVRWLIKWRRTAHRALHNRPADSAKLNHKCISLNPAETTHRVSGACAEGAYEK